MDGTVKLGDFGTARIEDKVSMTASGNMVGTPAYMSPEQIRGMEVDRRSDIFSLGCLFYEMITGKRPFDDNRYGPLFYQILMADPVPLSALEPSISKGLESVVSKALIKDPEQRYASIHQFKEDLRNHTTLRIQPPGQRVLRRRLLWAAIASAGLLGLAALVLVILLRSSEERIFLAVEPFANDTGKSEQQYMAIGFSTELSKTLAQQKSVVLIPFADIQDQITRGRPIQEAAKRASATFLVTGNLTNKGKSFFLDYTLIDCHSDKTRQDSLPVSAGNLLSAQDQICTQLFTWLKLKNERPQASMNPQVFELYLKGVSKIREME